REVASMDGRGMYYKDGGGGGERKGAKLRLVTARSGWSSREGWAGGWRMANLGVMSGTHNTSRRGDGGSGLSVADVAGAEGGGAVGGGCPGPGQTGACGQSWADRG